jgi:DNA-directed RNA polymerase subunit RPC12/RpoP
MRQRKPATRSVSSTIVGFKLCPRCGRAVPVSSGEKHCINDGEVLLNACPNCEERIAHPYAKHCSSCGYEFSLVTHADT